MLLSSETVGDDTARLVARGSRAKRFDRAFAEVSQLGEVRASTVTGTDVTAEYIDLQARLRILKAHREVIFGLYDQATTIDTTLRLDRGAERGAAPDRPDPGAAPLPRRADVRSPR